VIAATRGAATALGRAPGLPLRQDHVRDLTVCGDLGQDLVSEPDLPRLPVAPPVIPDQRQPVQRALRDPAQQQLGSDGHDHMIGHRAGRAATT
jgi:hypothetical protein